MICDRCSKETRVHSMSWFNTQKICVECQKRERVHPDFERARAAEESAVRQGNFNFPGVGWPGEERRLG